MSTSQEYDTAEPIAIVGMAMRFPGESHSSEQFWDMISKGRSAHSAIPKDRFNVDGYYHPDSARAGAINVKGSYFLSEDPRLFDAPFFSMTANEANGTDPQQRIMLEVAYEAFENAGIPIPDLVASQTSVYVGCFTKDFESVGGRDPYSGPFYAATGNGQSMLSNRVSWFFDLRGPSMTIDTACSSSLYAVHLACQSLRLKETKIALIGGTNLIADPAYMRDMVGMTFFSPDGVCHSFDHRANGYARGDGIGGMVLKTLKQALADGDTIRAIIRNSGLGQDGKTPGITMPSPQAHADLIRATYAGAGLSLDQTAYFEAHGTGTAIGDPYELSALGMTFGQTRSQDNPVYVGSVKSNMGHLEGGAGLAGLLKAVLVVERGLIPPLAGFEKANPRLKLDEWRVALPETLTTWPVGGVRRVSVNSFGYGGANAHVIVDDAYHYLEQHDLTGHHQTIQYCTDSSSDSGSSSMTTPASELANPFVTRNKLFLFSSADRAGLTRLSSAYHNLLSAKQLGNSESPEYLADLAYTLASRRTALDHRSFVVSPSIQDLSTQLQNPIPKLRRTAKNNNIFFIFTGQGAQWPTMGRDLIHYQVFNESLEKSQVELNSLGCSWSLVEEMFAEMEMSRIDIPSFSQPLCTALQLALVDLLGTWGIKPKAVVGHSSGEIAAAYAAGAITHQNAIKVAYLRGIYSADVSNRRPDRPGAMMSVGLSETDVQPYLSKVADNSAVVACINAPQSITLSGDETSITQLEKLINDDGIFARKIRVQTAYHSHHMAVIADDYLDSMGALIPPELQGDSGITMFSSVTAAPILAKEIDASYWIKNMVSTVRFSEAVNALVTQSAGGKTRRKVAVSYAAAIEIGPAEAFRGPLTQILTAVDERLATSILYTSMLSRKASAEVSALTAAGKLWAQGLNIDLDAVNFQGSSTRKHQSLASLPPYPWNHSKIYTHESNWGKAYRHLEKPRTDLLGMRLPNQDPTEPRWHNWVRLSEQPWMADHKVQQTVLYPGAAMIVMAIEAVSELVDPLRVLKAIETRDVLFKKPLLVPSGDVAVETAMHLRPLLTALSQKTSYSFRMFSQAGEDVWQENCSGSVSILYENGREEAASDELAWKSDIELFNLIRKRATKKISPRTFYKLFDKKMDLQYGPLHQNVTECVAGIGEGHGKITIPDTKSVMPSKFEYPHLIHPSTLDSIFHMQALGYLSTLSGEESLVPISIASVYVAASIPREAGTELRGYSKGTQSRSGDSIGDIVLSTDDWASPKVVVRGFLSRDVSAANFGPDNRTKKCTSFEWIEFGSEAILEIEAISGTDIVPKTQAPLYKLSELLILCGSVPSPSIQLLAHNLADAAMSISESVQVMSLLDVESLDFSGKTLISLVEAETSAVAKWTKSDFDHFKSIMLQAEAVLWVTRGGDYRIESELEFSITTGLLRTVRVERPQLKLPHIDLAPVDILATSSNVAAVLLAFQNSILNEDEACEQEFAVKSGKLMVPRLKKQETFHAELSSRSTQTEPLEARLADLPGHAEGLFDPTTNVLAWQQAQEVSKKLGELELEVELSFVHLEQADLVTEGTIGRDAVGTVRKVGSAITDFSAGDDVVVCGFQTMKTTVRALETEVQHLPDFVDRGLIATLPSALCTAHAVLLDLARLQPGDSVLICSTPGSLEHALIYLARQLNADVFVLAQNSHHKSGLIKDFGLGDDHVLQCTANEPFSSKLAANGVDIVATTLSGEAVEQSISCLRDWGRYISIGRHSLGSTAIPLARNISISNFDLEHMKIFSPAKFGQLFKRSWGRCREYGLPPASPFRTYPSSSVASAIAHLVDEKTVGSTVLQFLPHHQLAVKPAKPSTLTLDPTATYILSGGLGGIGRSIADMLFGAGARNITFISRSGAKSEEAQHLLNSLAERGCNAQAYRCDISDASQVQAFVDSSIERGETVKGVVQCAMVLRDSMFDNMTFEQWTESTQPKVRGSWNLHQAMPADLDFFIMLSSMAGVIGNPGQANYSAAGTYQDALSQLRRGKGLASTTIDLGIVSDVGYIAENPEQFERLDYLENLFISERDLHIILSAAMLGKTKNGEQVPAQLVTGVGNELLSEGSLGSAMSIDLKYIYLQESVGGGSSSLDVSEDKAIQDDLKTATSVREACAVVEGVLATQLSKALNMEKGDVDLEKPMHAFGVDSLVAVEVRNMIFRRMKADISVFDILSTQPLVKLAVRIVSKSKLVKQEIAIAAQDEVVD